MDGQNRITSYELTDKQKKYLHIKRAMDVFLSGSAIVVFSPLLLGIAVAIKLDSPGPVLFKQKRVGKNKELFEIYKFRTMRTDTPDNMPTHLLSDPDQYITRVGKFLRKTSLDELPQLFNIFKGEMYVVSTRPALWNQYDLMEERDKYGVHQIAPGLTGWAQINGRDELEIPVKARFDGEYIEKFGFWMDLKCFLGTIGSVLSRDGVMEGGTGEMKKSGTNEMVGETETVENAGNGNNPDAVVREEKVKKEIAVGGVVLCGLGVIGIGLLKALFYFTREKENGNREKKFNMGKKLIFGASLAGIICTAYVNVKRRVMLQDRFVEDVCKTSDSEAGGSPEEREETDLAENMTGKRILITGADSYIGTSVENWLKVENETSGKKRYQIDILDMREDTWKTWDFSKYDVVYHVAGIAHADVGTVTEEQKALYYKVNTDLTIEVAKKAKAEGVKQFIFMSSMIVYSGCKEKVITKDTVPNPLNFYGDSKWQADQKVRELASDEFKVAVIRPPMIYGRGSKGNYPELAKLAARLPVFPIVKNKRSMLHIDNLCQFVKLVIDKEEAGIFFPQNGEYTNTSDMVQMIAAVKGHRMIMVPFMNLPVKLLTKAPGKLGGLAEKAFGDLVYEMGMSECGEEYQLRTVHESIKLTEGTDINE